MNTAEIMRNMSVDEHKQSSPSQSVLTSNGHCAERVAPRLSIADRNTENSPGSSVLNANAGRTPTPGWANLTSQVFVYLMNRRVPNSNGRIAISNPPPAPRDRHVKYWGWGIIRERFCPTTHELRHLAQLLQGTKLPSANEVAETINQAVDEAADHTPIAGSSTSSTAYGFGADGNPLLEDIPDQEKFRLVEKNGKKYHCCKQCKREIVGRGDFNKHFRTHTKARPFPCRKHPLCKKRFGDASTRVRHEAVHENKRYECKHCGFQYTRKDNRDRHELKCNGVPRKKKRGSGGNYRSFGNGSNGANGVSGDDEGGSWDPVQVASAGNSDPLNLLAFKIDAKQAKKEEESDRENRDSMASSWSRDSVVTMARGSSFTAETQRAAAQATVSVLVSPPNLTQDDDDQKPPQPSFPSFESHLLTGQNRNHFEPTHPPINTTFRRSMAYDGSYEYDSPTTPQFDNRNPVNFFSDHTFLPRQATTTAPLLAHMLSTGLLPEQMPSDLPQELRNIMQTVPGVARQLPNTLEQLNTLPHAQFGTDATPPLPQSSFDDIWRQFSEEVKPMLVQRQQSLEMLGNANSASAGIDSIIDPVDQQIDDLQRTLSRGMSLDVTANNETNGIGPINNAGLQQDGLDLQLLESVSVDMIGGDADGPIDRGMSLIINRLLSTNSTQDMADDDIGDGLALLLGNGRAGHTHLLRIPGVKIAKLNAGNVVDLVSEVGDGHVHQVKLQIVDGSYTIQMLTPQQPHSLEAA